MKININEHNKALIVSVTGKMDVKNSPELEQVISAQIKGLDKTLILDFKELNYISSAGLRVVLLAAKQIKVNKNELLISGLQGTVKDVFELSGFYSIFKISETIDDALSTL